MDIWLFRARFFKSRGMAARFIRKGKLHVTRQGQTLRAKKPHTLVRADDVLTFVKAEQLIRIRVIASGTRRGPAPEARQLYENVTSDTPNA